MPGKSVEDKDTTTNISKRKLCQGITLQFYQIYSSKIEVVPYHVWRSDVFQNYWYDTKYGSLKILYRRSIDRLHRYRRVSTKNSVRRTCTSIKNQFCICIYTSIDCIDTRTFSPRKIIYACRTYPLMNPRQSYPAHAYNRIGPLGYLVLFP